MITVDKTNHQPETSLISETMGLPKQQLGQHEAELQRRDDGVLKNGGIHRNNSNNNVHQEHDSLYANTNTTSTTTTKKHDQRRVHFQGIVALRYTQSREDRAEERNLMHFTNTEYTAMKRRAFFLADMIERGRLVRDTEVECMRGLEALTPSGSRHREARKAAGRTAVLFRQGDTWINYDDMAQAYQTEAALSRSEALERGLKDAMAVQRILIEDTGGIWGNDSSGTGNEETQPRSESLMVQSEGGNRTSRRRGVQQKRQGLQKLFPWRRRKSLPASI